MILAAIDIGSNAVRLLIVEVKLYKKGEYDFTKLNLIRIPVRLGMDVFQTGKISSAKATALTATMQAFKNIMKVHQVEHYKAAATSALRDAKNGSTLVKKIYEQTNIDIKIISGTEEADTIFENHFAENLNPNLAHLYIDVGGGSTELTLFFNNKVIDRASFNIGTVRLLSKKVPAAAWKELENFTKKISSAFKKLDAIGSGGNINKVFNMSDQKENTPLSIKTLESYYSKLAPLSLKERMHQYQLKEDRADVIVHALKIYTQVMHWANIQQIFVPKIGMADGLVKILHKSILQDSKS
jgi:exopolyphosphatase / guanosine-5'-triphosphate,3'-diphosphate pyrophosphatase